MKENLRTTHYANGTSIPLGDDVSMKKPYRYYPDNNRDKYYGLSVRCLRN